MGTDCAPEVANLSLFSYEYEFMIKGGNTDVKLSGFL